MRQVAEVVLESLDEFRPLRQRGSHLLLITGPIIHACNAGPGVVEDRLHNMRRAEPQFCDPRRG